MAAINEINKLKGEIETLTKKNKDTTIKANETIGKLRTELMNMYRINYQLSTFKESVFSELKTNEIVKFNPDCFKGRLFDKYQTEFEKIKDEVHYFTIFKGKGTHLILYLNDEEVEKFSEVFEFVYKTPATLIQFNALKNSMHDKVENLNYFKCDIKDTNALISYIENR